MGRGAADPVRKRSARRETIRAGVAGVVKEILVKNADAVEFGQPLFRIDTG